MDVKDRLREARIYVGLSQEALAIATNSKRSTIAGYEHGISLPHAEFLKELSTKYNINPNWLLTGQGNMFNESPLLPQKSRLEQDIDEVIAVHPKFTVIEERLAQIEARLDSVDPAEGNYTSDPEPEYDSYERIPYVEDIAAGLPITQSEGGGLVIKVPAGYIRGNSADYYAAGVRGESMTGAGIPDGCVVLIRRADVPRHGAIQVVAWQGKSTLKRLKEKEGGGWELRFEDGTGRVIVVDSGEYLVQGDFVAVLPSGCRIE